MSKTILVVDDSRLSRRIVASLITKPRPDWVIVEADGPLEALDKVKDIRIDGATIDFNMPDMDGLTLAEKLKEMLPGVKMALVTANIQDATRQRAEQVGCSFIAKPVSDAKIEDLIVSWERLAVA